MTDVRDEIARISNAEFPREACGVVLLDDTVVHLANTAEDPFNTFVMDERDLALWWETEQVAAVWHSHPFGPAIPSEEDEASFLQAEVDHWDCLIYSVCDEDLGWYRLEDGRLRLVEMQGPE